MTEPKDWHKYFNEIFNGAWDCYSDASDEPYKQWIRKGARWATDFQKDLLSDLNFETEAKLAYKNKYKKLQKALDILRESNSCVNSVTKKEWSENPMYWAEMAHGKTEEAELKVKEIMG